VLLGVWNRLFQQSGLCATNLGNGALCSAMFSIQVCATNLGNGSARLLVTTPTRAALGYYVPGMARNKYFMFFAVLLLAGDVS
jgi:hypothetical protein